ncbi:hypothetical protein Tco_0454544 [Tanacetum coccineum]
MEWANKNEYANPFPWAGRVMAASIIPVSAKENLGDPIDIRVDVIHPEPVATVAFPAAAIMRTQAQTRGRLYEAYRAFYRSSHTGGADGF